MFKEKWEENKKLVEEALLTELRENTALNTLLCNSMKYSLTAGGKRLRPILLMAAADAAGGNGRDYLPAACALEMIHTYSLIHDDLPALDNDDFRRGKPTNHKVFGASIATMAGDALLTYSFEVICRQKGVSAEKLLQVINEISTAAGPNGMVGGQVIDLESEGKKIDMETLQKMHLNKTGALFRAAIRSGALLAGANDKELEALTIYADKFGLAFQITDDILDVIGDENEIGKPVGSDERNNKSTYVTLTSLEEAKKLAKETVEEAKKALEPFDSKADFLRELAQYLISRNK